MSNIKILTSVVLATALAGAAYAGPGGGGHSGGSHGGGSHGGGGYGGGGYGSGATYHGGGGYYGGGGMPYARGGDGRFGGGHHMRGSPRFEDARDLGRPAMSHFAASPNFAGGRGAHGRPEFNAHRDVRFSRNRIASTPLSDRSPKMTANAARNASRSSAVGGAPRNAANLRFPNAHAEIVTGTVTAGSHDSRGGHGWWRHRNGGFGWIGPVFWPFAYNDIYDYTLWGYGYDDPFWDYGYSEIYAGIFTPYDYDADELTGSRRKKAGSGRGPQVQAPQVPAPQVQARPRDVVTARPQATVQATVNVQPRDAVGVQTRKTANDKTVNAPPDEAVNARTGGPQAALPSPSAQMCGEDSRDIAGLPIDQIQAAIAPNDAQRAALDDLANASMKAADAIRTGCPTEVSLTAPGRLASMQQRIESMISAVDTIQPALRKFSDLLTAEQKTRLNALRSDQRREPTANNNADAVMGNCDAGQAKVPPLPMVEIDAKIHPTRTQRKGLLALRDATAQAAEMLSIPCPTSAEVVTPLARLESVRQRLGLTKQAITVVLAALDDFYGELSEEQKAQFETIGQRRPTAAADQPNNMRGRVRHPVRGLNSMARQ